MGLASGPRGVALWALTSCSLFGGWCPGGETIVVAGGRPQQAVAPDGCIWKAGGGCLEGVKRGRAVSSLYASRTTGDGDFHIRATLSIAKLGRGAAFDLPDHRARFIFDQRVRGKGPQMVARGTVLGQKRGAGVEATEYLKEGVPFAFEAVRKGEELTLLIDGRSVHKVQAAGVDLGRAGFTGIGLRVLDFSIEGATGAKVELPPVKALTEPEIKMLSYPVKLQKPLAYGKGFVEVTADNTLRRRYRVWGDWDREVQACLEEAREKAKARGTPPRKVTMGCIFLKDATIELQPYKGGDGKPLRGTYTTPPAFVQAMRTRGMQDYSDFMFAFSGGELEVEWVAETLEGMHWVQTHKTRGWSCQPKALGDQVIQALAKHKDAGVCMWMFCAGRPTTLNPDPKDPMVRIGPPPFGISYTKWPLHGGYTLVICAPIVGLLVHEFNHRYLDGLPSHEGIQLTMFHGLGMLGYEGWDLGYPPLLNTYRSVYQHIIRRDMWRRFTITGHNRTPREPFSGKAYAWDAVKHDCWFKLPELSNAELAKLTGIPSFEMDAPRKAKYRLYKVADADRPKVLSPCVAEPSEKDVALNNLLALPTESCAVLRTATGHWLFVRPDLADVYVDMLALSGKGREPLPAYGYVLEGVRPLLVLKAPADLSAPAHELGYFRR